MKKQKLDLFDYPEGAKVRVTDMGKVCEVKYSSGSKPKCKIKKVNKYQYILRGENQLRYFNNTSDRSASKDSMRRSMRKLNELIITNVVNESNCKFITLTYKDSKVEYERLKPDFKAFNRAARKKWGAYEYICIYEPQKNENWHMHVILIFACKAPFMSKEEVELIWKMGFVNVRNVTDSRNLGKYFIAHLSDTPENADNDDLKSKKYIKGGRINLYPSGKKLYSCSKGIVKAKTNEIPASEIESLMTNKKLVEEYSVVISNDEETWHKLYDTRIYKSDVSEDENDNGEPENGNQP